MKLISIFTIDASNPPAPPDEQMHALIAELMASGKMIDTGGILPTGVSFRVKHTGSAYGVTDGPFTESKEIVGGFALLNVDSKQEAIALAQRFLDLTGTGTCELHEVSETPAPVA